MYYAIPYGGGIRVNITCVVRLRWRPGEYQGEGRELLSLVLFEDPRLLEGTTSSLTRQG